MSVVECQILQITDGALALPDVKKGMFTEQFTGVPHNNFCGGLSAIIARRRVVNHSWEMRKINVESDILHDKLLSVTINSLAAMLGRG